MITKRSFILRGSCFCQNSRYAYILLTKTTTAQNEAPLSYHRVRGLYLPAVVFAASIYPGFRKNEVASITGLIFVSSCFSHILSVFYQSLVYPKIPLRCIYILCIIYLQNIYIYIYIYIYINI